MQIWTFSKHHTFKYEFWEKTQYSNMNFWCFLVAPGLLEGVDLHNPLYLRGIMTINYQETGQEHIYNLHNLAMVASGWLSISVVSFETNKILNETGHSYVFQKNAILYCQYY